MVSFVKKNNLFSQIKHVMIEVVKFLKFFIFFLFLNFFVENLSSNDNFFEKTDPDEEYDENEKQNSLENFLNQYKTSGKLVN